ncbi:DNA polymerase III subunit gamma/tau [Candidatus Fermentibacterales bacterium]|nr:DNA polymerase III subunit gamma/tau [Candidatus Fermentibacterales bacterium]
MSYLVFARKWRPQSFDEILAQEHVTVTLKNALDTGRIGHAYLFAGPRGIGKTTTARILAKALNCVEGPTSRPCQKCDSCLQITAGTHLDVLEIDGASNRGIDEIRDLREKARYATASGRYKTYIIDEVHMLTKEAFNALLKILEEPPGSVVFVFATTEPRKVPATIVSRCQRFDFRRIPARAMADYIRTEASSEQIEIDDEALRMICRASGGSMRDALSLMDQLVSFSGTSISSKDVAGLLGLVEVDMLASLSAAMLEGRGAEALEVLDSALESGYDVEEITNALQEFLRNVLLSAAGAARGPAELSESEAALVDRIAGGHSDLEVLNVLRLVAAASNESRTSSLPRVVLETAVLAASRLADSMPVKELEQKQGRAAPPRERVVRSASGPASSGQAPEPKADALLESLQQHFGDGDLAEALSSATATLEGGRLILALPGLRDAGDLAERMAEFLAGVLGRPIGVELRGGPETRGDDAPGEDGAAGADGEETRKVQQVLDLLDAIGYEGQ